MAKRPAQRGVTLVELLVTIVLVGIFFAAMVPVFVLASKQGSADRARVVAVNVGQSRIEAIRSMPYDSIDATRLATLEGYARTDSGFDPRFDGAWKDPDKPGKAYAVSYEVAEVNPGTTVDYPHRYKMVTVTVGWNAAGLDRSVVLKTAVYRQTSGPQILGLTVSPLAQGTGHLITSGQVTVSVTVNGLDVAVTKYVWITIYANNGSQVATAQILNSDAHDTSVYTWLWDADAAGAPDGPYSFIAVAVADQTGQPGNMVERQFFLDRQQPQPPDWDTTNSPPVVSWNAIMIVWKPQPAIGDLDHYEVVRTDVGGVSRTFPTADESTGLPRWSSTLIDRDGLQPNTAYTYRVRAVDTSGRPSEWSEPLTLTTAGSGASAGPSPPMSISAQQVMNTATNPASPKCEVKIDWGRSQSATQPDDANVTLYFLYRSQSDEPVPATDLLYSSPLTVMRVTTHQVAYSSNDPTVDWGRDYVYQVSAANADLQESGRTTSAQVHVAPPAGTLGFKLFASVPASVQATKPSSSKWYARFSVVWLDTGQVYPVGGITAIRDRVAADDPKSSYTISGLPFGEYQIIATFYIGGGGSGDTFIGWSSVTDTLLTVNQPETIIFTPAP